MVTKVTYNYARDIGYYPAIDHPHGLSKYESILKLEQSRTSTPNPKYKQIIKDEGNATTALQAHSQYASVSPYLCKIFYTDGDQANDTWGGLAYSAMPVTALNIITPAQVSEAQAKATAQIYKTIAKYQTPFNGQVFGGELREVMDLVRNPFAKSAKLTDSFLRTFSYDGFKLRNVKQLGSKAKRNMDRNASKIPAAVADSWLEYQFAVAPLIKDVASLLTLAIDIADKREHETVRGYGESISTTSSVSTAGGPGYTIKVEETTTSRCQNIIRCGMTAKFIDTVKNTNSPNKWIDIVDDFSNIPITAWELTPFSFLVDYFVNVQDILQSAVVGQTGIAYTSNSLIKTYEVQRNHTGGPAISHLPYIRRVELVTPKKIVTGVRGVTRTGTLLGIPPVVFSLPGSNMRYANIAALMTKLL